MPTWLPQPDHTEEIIKIAQRVQNGVGADNFATVFNAVIRVMYPQSNNVEVQVNQAMGKDTATEILQQLGSVYNES
jgi:hypothetical protein